MRSWTKRGVVVTPNPDLWWMQSHAMLPTPDHLGDGVYKIYFSGRNQQNQSIVGYAVIDMDAPDRVSELSANPVFGPGRLGAFDDNGVLPSCVVRTQGQHQLFYYIGFKPGGTTRMDLFGGLAESQDGGESFTRWSEAPILERCRANPFINTAPWVVPVAGGYRIYYVAGVEWVHKDLPRYNIQTAFSVDGKIWDRKGDVAIDFAEGENALARPYVLRTGRGYEMWFSSKGSAYLPQHAISQDGVTWQRSTEMERLRPSAGGPDEEMICYPIVIEHKGQKHVFYNGNGYGLNGLCLASED